MAKHEQMFLVLSNAMTSGKRQTVVLPVSGPILRRGNDRGVDVCVSVQTVAGSTADSVMAAHEAEGERVWRVVTHDLVTFDVEAEERQVLVSPRYLTGWLRKGKTCLSEC